MFEYAIYGILGVGLPILGIVGHKVWLKYKPSAAASAYADGVKLVQKLAALNTPATAAEQAKAAATQAHLEAMKATFKAEVDKLLA